MRLVLFIALGATLGSVSNAEDTSGILCPYHEEFLVSFTSWEKEDTFSIDLLGDDCAKSIRVITVRDSNNRPIYTNSVRLQQLAAQPLSYDDTLESTLEAIRKSISGKRSSALPEFESPNADPENFYQGGEENRKNYERARAADSPVMCVRFAWEYWECFWYDSQKRSVKYLYGIGA